MNFEVVKSQVIYKGRIMDLRVDTLRTDRGGEFKREILVHPGAVVIIPLLGEDRVILIKQYRHAAERSLWEFPAGTLEAGEAVEECARRELLEEIGYEAKAISPILSFFPSPGISTEKMFVYLAKDPVLVEPKPLEADTITAKTVPLSDLPAIVERGEIIDAKTIIGVYYLVMKMEQGAL